MREINLSVLEEKLCDLIKQACTCIRADALSALKNAKERESNPTAAFALDMLCKNAALCQEKELPVCQDTGMAVVFLDIGQEVHLIGGELATCLDRAVAKAYADNALRMSVLDPFTRINTKTNTPAILHTRIVPGDRVKITFMPKGFGSENMSRLFMLMPADGKKGVVNAVVQAVRDAGSKPCPPVFVGVGVGGTSELALELSKRALLRKIGESNPDETLRDLEAELTEKLNALSIGAQGFGGDTTAFAVHILSHPTHITALPVGVSIQCNCVRSAEVIL